MRILYDLLVRVVDERPAVRIIEIVAREVPKRVALANHVLLLFLLGRLLGRYWQCVTRTNQYEHSDSPRRAYGALSQGDAPE